MIIALEGVDGAGKNTLARELIRRSGPAGARLISFPRYGHRHADLAAAALRGEMGDLLESRCGMAVLFALDRAEVAGELAAHAGPDRRGLLILDRYVASNAAYSAARAEGDAAGRERVAEWVADLEFGRLGLPRPDLTVLVPTAPELARRRAREREEREPGRERDRWERDAALQDRTWLAYRELAARNWQGPWLVTDDPHGILREQPREG